METTSPFSLLQGLVRDLPLPELKPPAWAVSEVQRRLVLLLNHILMQEREATLRIARQKGRVVRLCWRSLEFGLLATPAGLLDLAPVDQHADLRLSIAQESPAELLRLAMAGEKPAVHIEGDVMMAAELNWLVDHVRWDLEEDLARLLGDVPARVLGQVVRQALAAVRQLLGARPPGPVSGTAA